MRGCITRSSSEIDDYPLEIGQSANCDVKMASVAAHTDEILEFLESLDSHIAKLLTDSICDLERQTRDKLEKEYNVMYRDE